MTPLPSAALGLQPVTLIQALLPTAGFASSQGGSNPALNQLSLGQRVVAEVQAQLSDGSFLVKIADTTTRMNLPVSTMVGEKLPLTLVEKTPLPTFMLNAKPAANTTDSSVMSLSNAGRLIATLLQQGANPATAAPVLGKMPIVAQANLPAPQLAHALQETLTTSGLFYESHLSQWAGGQRTTAALMQEPQASQTTQIVQNAGATIIPGNTRADTSAYSSANPAAAAVVAGSTQAQNNVAPASISNPVLGQLVQQQLQTLEQNRIVWQGEVWPGQTLQWEVSEDAGQQGEAPQTLSTATWSSKVRFELPTLGVITAHLRLNGTQLSMQIRADNTATVQQLQAQGPALSNALAAAGIPLAALQVNTSE